MPRAYFVMRKDLMMSPAVLAVQTSNGCNILSFRLVYQMSQTGPRPAWCDRIVSWLCGHAETAILETAIDEYYEATIDEITAGLSKDCSIVTLHAVGLLKPDKVTQTGTMFLVPEEDYKLFERLKPYK